MSELKICRVCLRTEAKVYQYDQYQLKTYYEEILALTINEPDDLPRYFCFECSTMLHKFHKFKDKCLFGQKILKEMLWKGPITYEQVYKIDRATLKLHSPLEKLNLKYNVVKLFTTNDCIPIKEEAKLDQRRITAENTEVDNFEVLFDNDMDPVKDPEDSDTDSNVKSPVSCEITAGKNCKRIKSETSIRGERTANENIDFVKDEDDNDIEEQDFRKKSIDSALRLNKLLDSKHWKKIRLSEEEALKEFGRRAESQRYLSAAHKCTDCCKGFSKDEMLRRHRKLRHNESKGSYECCFCHMRFKWNCHLNKHLRQHYTKYECLRCGMICPLENTALLHDVYHSGITKKCRHCNEEFRHTSTYYTHLRTHRSEYLCTLCGSSFVSEAGLHQHKRVKHCVKDIESPDDDEEVNTFCSRCDIRFETRKAYDEHLFHSANHTEGVEEEIKTKNIKPRKVLGKGLKAKITNQLKSRKPVEEVFEPQKRKSRKLRRMRTKPTTCHQCGKHFETQAACMKHHLAEHPRTSFFAPNERHICEICGASLAPGSVSVHQNMHSREKVHPCSTCGKQFHSAVGLKRHSVTHTGEKPYGCTLCDKRFTQNNSMKLHYRTFHLMQPYPKRNRRKRKGEIRGRIEAEDSVESDDNTPLSKRTTKKSAAAIEPAPNAAEPIVTENSDIDYLTLGYQ